MYRVGDVFEDTPYHFISVVDKVIEHNGTVLYRMRYVNNTPRYKAKSFTYNLTQEDLDCDAKLIKI